MTHYVLEHPVHHVSAMIPHYHLKQAQAALAGIVAPNILSMRFTVGNMRDVLRRCRLYDYDAHAWLDFNGELTAVPFDPSTTGTRQVRRSSGGLLPDQAQPGSPGIFFPPDQAASATTPIVSAENDRV
jgi:hypothetical protein